MNWRHQNIRLRRLEAEAIYIMREVVGEFRNPVMLYSIGKDSSVMLHLALKAFYPAQAAVSAAACRHDLEIPRDDRVSRRDRGAARHGSARPYQRGGACARHLAVASGSALHTQVMKTEGLRQALDKWRFDAAFGGARRDEEKSRAKERIFSFRSAEPCLGPAQSAARAVAAVQYPHQARRIHAGVSAVQLDRARRLGIHHGREHSGRAALFRQAAPGGASATAR